MKLKNVILGNVYLYEFHGSDCFLDASNVASNKSRSTYTPTCVITAFINLFLMIPFVMQNKGVKCISIYDSFY